MNRGYKVTALVALVILLLAVVGSFTTQGIMEYLPFLHSQKGGWSGESVSHGIVDQRPWQTAAALAVLAESAEERELAREAERVADHEVDQAFSQSLRQASLNTKSLAGEALTLQRHVLELQKTVKDDQDRVNALTPKSSPPANLAAAAVSDQNDLEVAKAQLGLDQNELSDSLEDLARESGDQRITIQQELSAREAAMTKYDARTKEDIADTAVTAVGKYRTLAGQISVWRAQRNRKRLIEEAEQLARADVSALTEDHTRLEAEIRVAETQAGSSNTAEVSRADRIYALQRLAEQRNVLSILNDRLGAQQQLLALYVRWGKQVDIQHKMLFHLMLQSIGLIAFIVLMTILLSWALQSGMDRLLQDRRQKQTLRTVMNLVTQGVGLLLILLVIFGIPKQTPTILGLATAGLTVVFQDFILAFCGWFVIMGPNGIRINDWVEIDGVGGEVVEIGVFRTWLLETGNWTANGHPTGRRVSFLNGYAIRGKYFNFSTVGQWMWDEIKVNIPPEADTYSLIDQIREAVVKATETDAKMAEAEWKRVTHEEGSPHFSAMPSVDMRPAPTGVDIVLRYITRAGVRLETRNHLFQVVIDLIKGRAERGSNESDTVSKGS